MARPRKRGIEYFPFDVDFFSDKKIRILKSRFGADGIAIYLYLLCEVYKNGYFIQIDEDYEYIIADDLSMSNEKVKQVLKFLLERSLLDSKLFQSDTIITSRGIQCRFQEAIKTRASKSDIEVESKYWLLSDSETQPFIKFTHNYDYSEKNPSYSEKNPSYSEKNNTKESKGKESINNTVHSGEMHEAESLEDFYESIWELYPLKKGKGKVSKTKKQVLQRIGYEQIKRCIERYVADTKFTGKEKYMMHGSTFFNSGYVDYLDQNYTDSYKLENQKDEFLEDDEELVGDDW